MLCDVNMRSNDRYPPGFGAMTYVQLYYFNRSNTSKAYSVHSSQCNMYRSI